MRTIQSNYISLENIIKCGQKKLINAHIPNAKKEIEWFLSNKFSISLGDIIINKTYKLNPEEIKKFNQFIERRIEGEPFQYIINQATFYGFDFFVNNKTLIPRPETELIISVTKKFGPYDRALDIGTGSGNIAIILSQEKIAKQIDAIDISDEALKSARYNYKKHNLNNINFLKLNFLAIKMKHKYDLIVSNPPYVSNIEYSNLGNHIKCYEPRIALTDDEDGFKFYKFFAKNLNKILKPKGRIVIEIGLEHTKKTIENLFTQNNFKCTWYKDLNGSNRVFEAHQ